jgi:putative oxidoreductase
MGDWAHFVRYCGVLNSYAPVALIPALAWISTALEVAFGIAFLAGFQLEYVAYGSAILFTLFALGMTWGTGIKSPLDASVFADAAGSFLFGALVISTKHIAQNKRRTPETE